MYFPKLPAVSQAPQGIKPSTTASRPSPAPGQAAKGLVYPGPQEIISDPPEPTNSTQTLIQPALKNAPILDRPLALPNLVLVADAGLAAPRRPLPPTAKEPAEEQPKPEPAPPPPANKPEPAPAINVSNVVTTAPLPLKPAQVPDMVASPPPRADIPAKEEPNPEPVKTESEKPVDLGNVEAASVNQEQPKGSEQASSTAASAPGPDLETVVALSPMPAAPDQAVKIPIGEARGRFAISPRPNLSGANTGAPSTIAGDGSKPVVVGIETDKASAPAVTTSPTAAAPPASITISFGSGPAIKEKAPGSGVGAAVSGSGSAPAAPKTAFAGITVTGGIEDGGGGSNASRPPQTRRPLQTSYGVSVISTESSGGGLPSFGLFSNHDIYTVYVDMREVETDSNPSWTLEVAVAQYPPVPGNTAKNIAVAQGLVLPFPLAKKQPSFPPDLVSKHLRKSIIVYGVINVDGTMEQISVKQSPDPALNQSVLAALSQWAFRPATRNGIPFAVKVLLGIPLWVPQQVAPPRHVSISTAPPS